MRKVVGIIGRSGAGKTTFVQFLKEFDIVIIDADIEARNVMEKGSEALKEAVSYFGVEILNEDHTLNRKKLGEIVFNDQEKLQKLNSITWNKIVDNIITKVSNTDKNVLIDCALLTETKLKDICDEIVLITSKHSVERIVVRDNISIKLAFSRVKSQNVDLESDATITIVNDGNLEELKIKANKLYSEVFE